MTIAATSKNGVMRVEVLDTPTIPALLYRCEVRSLKLMACDAP
ncbi:hypothetical protein [Iningainema tapete]|nr:hypothetical protein [Iningainema tapete]